MSDTVSRIGLISTILSVIATRVGSKLVVVVSFLLLGWSLGAEAFGYYAMISASVFIAFQFANFGLRQAGSHFIGQNPASERVVMRSMALFFPVALLIFVVVVWTLISTGNAITFPSGSLAVPVLMLTLLAGLGAVTLSYTQGISLGRGQIGVFNLSNIVQQVSAALVVLFFVTLNLLGVVQFGLSLAVWSLVAGFLAGGVFGLLRVLPAAPGEPDDPSPLRMLGALLRRGWLYALVLLLLTINSRLTIFFLGGMNPADAGQFFLAQRLSEAFMEIAGAVGLVMFSLGARSKDSVAILRQSAVLTRGLILMAILTGPLIGLFVPELMRRLFSLPETIGLLPILLLVATLPFVAVNRTCYQTLAGLGQTGIAAIGFGGAVLLNGATATVLIPHFGIAGAVSGLLVGQFFVTVVLLSFIRIRYKLPSRLFLFARKSDFVRFRDEMFALLQRVRK